MEAFLNALSPSVRESTREALARENGEARLRQVVSRYIDEEGNWPTEPTTADYLARAFISRTDDVVASFAPYGLKGPTIAALSVGALSLGKGKALIALGSKLAGKYWVEMTSYAVGVNPALAIAMRGVIGYSTNAADWLGISRKMEGGFDEQVWKDEFADEYASSLERSILGRLAQSAWRGSRSAANHITSKRVGDVSVNEWVENYVAKVARSQADLTVRTARHIVENSLHLPANVMGGRLEQMWALTPHHVDSANKYRAGLEKQDRSASWVNKMTDRYADRLMRQRVDTVAMTEAMTAFNLGRETQWIRSVRDGTLPADTVKMWITGQDEKVCEVCEPMDGKTAPLGEVFEDINLYVPSAHPNCRCIVIPAQLGVASSDEPQLVFPIHDVVEKRTITVREYTRSDGTVVEEHQRKIDPASPSSDSGSGSSSRILSGFTDARVREFLENFSRDGELTYHEATALGTMAAAAIALGSRGRIRRGMNPTIYDEMGLLPSGQLVVPPKLMESLRKTYTYKSPNSGLRTEIKSINVETAPHHTYAGQRLHEMLGGQADMPALLRGKQTLRGRVADRYLVKRDNIFVEAQVVNPQGRTVGRFETTIDPRKREVFQDGFFMDTNYQGSGFSGEFTAHIGKRYLDTGIDSIGVFAGGPVGGYAWASLGFGWRYGPSKDVLQRLAEAQRRTDLYPEPVIREIRDTRRRIILGFGTGKWPTPQEISQIGRSTTRVQPGASTSAGARETWAGKDILLGSNWHASLSFRDVRSLLRKEGVIKSLSPRHLSRLSVGSAA